MKDSYVKLTQTDKTILESYRIALDGFASYFGDGYEFVLHNLENLDKSVIKIINGHYTGRVEGAPITDLALSMLEKIRESNELKSLCYFNKNKLGTVLKSTTIPIIGENSRIIGLLCINFYTNTPFANILANFTPNNTYNSHVAETFAENIDDLILSTLEEAKIKIYNDHSISTKNKNKELINYLYDMGVFNLKDAVIKVADSLSISKNTVYMHIRNIQENQNSQDHP